VIALQRQLRALDVPTAETGSPRAAFFAGARRAMYALVTGHLDEADRLIARAAELGAGTEEPDVEAVTHSLAAARAERAGERRLEPYAGRAMRNAGAMFHGVVDEYLFRARPGAGPARRGQHDSALARQLRDWMHTGSACRYNPGPARPVTWILGEACQVAHERGPIDVT
jgi:hypothetical protein